MREYNITVAYETLNDFPGSKSIKGLRYTISAEEYGPINWIEDYVKDVGESGFFDGHMYVPSARIVCVEYYPVEEEK